MSAEEEALAELTSDIENARVREMIVERAREGKGVEGRAEGRRRAEEVLDQENYLKQFQERKWLTRKGKKYLIDFDNEERREMKQCFNSLDERKTGSIGIDELEELLFSVGLFETRQEIKALIDSVDEDKSGKIEFGEFLSMIQNDEGQNEEIVSFFKTVIGGKLRQGEKAGKPKRDASHKVDSRPSAPNRHDFFQGNPQSKLKGRIPEILEKYPYPKGLPFEMVISHIRRKHMMTALNISRSYRRDEGENLTPDPTSENTMEQVAKGQRVMHALQKMYERKLVRQIKERKRTNERLKPTTPKPKDKFRISFASPRAS